MARTGKGAAESASGKRKVEIGKIESEIEGENESAADAKRGKLKEESGKIEDESATSPEESGSELHILCSDLEAELSAERNKYLRLAAEYDNYRKRSAKEREMIYGDARADAITRLLPVYDNLERALKMECADEAFLKGIEMTMTQLTEILENMDVKSIPAVGERFDPNRHNAVMTIENADLGEKTVAEEFQKGFTLGDRVIRFSTVVVAN